MTRSKEPPPPETESSPSPASAKSPLPAPAEIRSLPRLPRITSTPVPPKMRSLPFPPSSASSPSPASIQSLPPPPKTRSLPPPTQIRSLPPRPSIVWLPFLATITSAVGVPRRGERPGANSIVAARPRQVAGATEPAGAADTPSVIKRTTAPAVALTSQPWGLLPAEAPIPLADPCRSVHRLREPLQALDRRRCHRDPDRSLRSPWRLAVQRLPHPAATADQMKQVHSPYTSSHRASATSREILPRTIDSR